MINLNNVDINLINKNSIKKINQNISIKYDIKKFSMPNIEECEGYSDYADEIEMTSLKKCSFIRSNTKELVLPNLEYVYGNIDTIYSRIIYLPKLKSVKNLYFNTAREVYLYSLESVRYIECQNAKFIVVPKKIYLTKIHVFSLNPNCEIIYTENYIKKESFSFKSFFIEN